MNKDGVWESTVDRAARLTAALCFDFGWGIDDIKQHNNYPRQDGTFKDCPSVMRDEGGAGWVNFISLVQHYLSLVFEAEGFPHGFHAKKEASSDGAMIFSNQESKADGAELLDADHGVIVIPEELLSETK